MSTEQAFEVFVDGPLHPGDPGEIHINVAEGDSSLVAYFGPARELGHLLIEWGFEGLGELLGRQNSSVAYLSSIEVEPAFRRRGIGTLMILRLVQHLEERKIHRLFLHAQGTLVTPSEALEAFYLRLGFQPEESCDGDIYPVYRLSVSNP